MELARSLCAVRVLCSIEGEGWLVATQEQLPTTLNVRIVQGDTWTKSFVFRDAVTQDPVDVSAWTVSAQIRKDASTERSASFSVDMSEAVDGVVTLRLSHEDSKRLLTSGVWEMQRSVGGDVRTLISGTFSADREIAR